MSPFSLYLGGIKGAHTAWACILIPASIFTLLHFFFKMLRPNSLSRPLCAFRGLTLSPSAVLVLRTRAASPLVQLRSISRIALIKKNKDKIKAQTPEWKPPFPGWKPDPETEVSKHKNVRLFIYFLSYSYFMRYTEPTYMNLRIFALNTNTFEKFGNSFWHFLLLLPPPHVP